MKKTFLSLILLVFITGCSTEYNLEFKNNKLTENIKVGTIDLNLKEEIDLMEPIASYKDYDIQYYDIKRDNDIVNLNHTYTVDEFRMSSVLIDCFDLATISEDDKYYYILSSGKFKCMSYLDYKNDEVKINFSTDLKVESNNADEVKDNVYTWIYNDNNTNKEINLKLVKKAQKNSKTLYIIVAGIIILILLIVPFMLYVRHKNKEKNISEDDIY